MSQSREHYHVSITAMQPVFLDVVVEADSPEQAVRRAVHEVHTDGALPWNIEHELENIDAYVEEGSDFYPSGTITAGGFDPYVPGGEHAHAAGRCKEA